MEVILLTIFLSLMLVLFFIGFFVHQKGTRGFGGIESDALMPIDDEEHYRPERKPKKKDKPKTGVSDSKMNSSSGSIPSGPNGF